MDYLKIHKDLALGLPSTGHLTYKQLLLYKQIPRDIAKMSPFLIISLLPLAQYVTLPLAMSYPRLLSSQYWTDDQKVEINEKLYKTKHAHYKQLLYHIIKKLDIDTKIEVDDQTKLLDQALGQLANQRQCLSVDQILHLKPIFTEPTSFLEFHSLSYLHLVNIGCVHHSLD